MKVFTDAQIDNIAAASESHSSRSFLKLYFCNSQYGRHFYRCNPDRVRPFPFSRRTNFVAHHYRFEDGMSSNILWFWLSTDIRLPGSRNIARSRLYVASEYFEEGRFPAPFAPMTSVNVAIGKGGIDFVEQNSFTKLYR
jgi:hypothetical protein